MKRALCFVVLINKEAKTVLDWLLSDKFIRGFHMYDLRSVGTYAGSIDKMESSVYTTVVHNGYSCVYVRGTPQRGHTEKHCVVRSAHT